MSRAKQSVLAPQERCRQCGCTWKCEACGACVQAYTGPCKAPDCAGAKS